MDYAVECFDCIGDVADGQYEIDGEFLPFHLRFTHVPFCRCLTGLT